MVDSLANLVITSVDKNHMQIKNEIMFCDIIAVQVEQSLLFSLVFLLSSDQIQDLADPTKLMITYNSVSTFISPPNQAKGYFFKSRLFPLKHATSHRVYEFR